MWTERPLALTEDISCYRDSSGASAAQHMSISSSWTSIRSRPISRLFWQSASPSARCLSGYCSTSIMTHTTFAHWRVHCLFVVQSQGYDVCKMNQHEQRRYFDPRCVDVCSAGKP